MVGCGRRPHRRRAGEAVLRRQRRRAQLVDRDARPRSGPAGTTGYEQWVLNERRARGSPRLRRRRRRSRPSAPASAPTTRSNIALRHADVFPLAIGLSGNYDPTTWNAGASRATPPTSTTRWPTSRNLHGDHLDWLRGRLSLLLVVGQGAWEVDPTRRAAEHARASPPCSATRASGTSSTCGATTSRTTGRPGAPSCATTCRDSARGGRRDGAPDRSAARHRERLAGGVRGPAASGVGTVTDGHGERAHASTSSGSPSSRSTCAPSRATTS